jgi:hypothetical protein
MRCDITGSVRHTGATASDGTDNDSTPQHPASPVIRPTAKSIEADLDSDCDEDEINAVPEPVDKPALRIPENSIPPELVDLRRRVLRRLAPHQSAAAQGGLAAAIAAMSEAARAPKPKRPEGVPVLSSTTSTAGASAGAAGVPETTTAAATATRSSLGDASDAALMHNPRNAHLQARAAFMREAMKHSDTSKRLQESAHIDTVISGKLARAAALIGVDVEDLQMSFGEITLTAGVNTKLEKAARVLGVDPEELRQSLQQKLANSGKLAKAASLMGVAVEELRLSIGKTPMVEDKLSKAAQLMGVDPKELRATLEKQQASKSSKSTASAANSASNSASAPAAAAPAKAADNVAPRVPGTSSVVRKSSTSSAVITPAKSTSRIRIVVQAEDSD